MGARQSNESQSKNEGKFTVNHAVEPAFEGYLAFINSNDPDIYAWVTGAPDQPSLEELLQNINEKLRDALPGFRQKGMELRRQFEQGTWQPPIYSDNPPPFK
ncbi:MAG: succinate dehydrogenase assembly factor 2 [Nitrososphaerales archaeon]